MPDQKPARLAADERATLQGLLQFQRESVVRKVSDVGDRAGRVPLVPSGTSLLWLVKHLTTAEATWIVRRFAGAADPVPDDTVGPEDTLAGAAEAYRASWAGVDAVVDRAASLDDPCRGMGDEPPANLRWVLMHLLEETARHAGHADILRELIDGQTGR